MKKLLSLLLVLTLSLSLVAGIGVSALADEEPAATETTAAEHADGASDPTGDIRGGGISSDTAGDTPVDAPKSDTPADAPEGGTPADAPEGETPADAPEGGTPADVPEGDTPADTPVDDTSADAPEGGAPADAPEGGTPADAPEGGTPADTPVDDTSAETLGLDGAGKTNEIGVGGKYIFVAGDKAIAVVGGAVTTKAYTGDKNDPEIVWEAVKSSSSTAKHVALKNGGVYLGDTGTAIDNDKKGNWFFSDGKFAYDGKSLQYVIVGDGISLGSDGTAMTLVTVTEATGGYTEQGSSGGSGSGGGSSSSSSTGYADAKGRLSEGYVVLAIGADRIAVSMDQGKLIGTAVTPKEDGTVSASKGTYMTIQKSGDGYVMFAYDPPDKNDSNKQFFELTASGGVFVNKTPTGVWNVEPGKGGKLYFTAADGATYYIAGAAAGKPGSVSVTTNKDEAVDVKFYIGTEEPKGGGGGKPPSSGETVDADAPTFTTQPQVVHFVYEGSGYDAPKYSVKAELPKDSKADGITLQWFIDGNAVGSPETTKGKTASSSLTANQLKDKSAGLYKIYCQATCTVEGKDHSAKSYTVNFIVCKGVQTNSVITFSDVHETWDDVGTAIYDTIIATKGLIPALVVATGDYNNDHLMGNDPELIQKCIDTLIFRIGLQLGGIDTVWVSGNHDNGYATGFTNANEKADLGFDADNYQDIENGISGTGIIYNSNEANSADSSLANDGLIVIGINYEDMAVAGAVTGGNVDRSNQAALDYGGPGSTGTVYEHLKLALDKIAADYHGELVVISTHAGIHVLGVDSSSKASGADEWAGSAEYNITNSAAIVDLVNSYVEDYDMDIMWLFGHDHSKGEQEFYKKPGDTITSTVSYPDQTKRDIVLKFTYAHAGYVGKGAAGNVHQRYTYLTWDDDTITRTEGVADGKHATEPTLTFELERKADDLYLTTDAPTYTPPEDVKKEIDDAAKAKGYTVAAYFDVNPVWSDGTEASDRDVSANGGVVVELALPKGVTSASDVIVLHRPRPGKMETIGEDAFIFTDNDSLRLHADSLSPFAIAVKEKTEQKSNDSTKAPAKAPAKAPDRAPKTGDETDIVLWVVVLTVCVGGVAAALLPRRKSSRRT